MISESDIPHHWEVKTIEEVVKEAKNGGTPTRSNEEYWQGDIPWLSSGEVRGKYTTDSPDEYITEKGLEESSVSFWPEGAVLVAMYGKGTIGRSAIAGIRTTGNQAICGLIPDEDEINNEFLYYWLEYIRDFLANKGRGATASRQNLNRGLIIETNVPVPPLDEQERIVEFIEERLARIDSISKSIGELDRFTEEYRESLLAFLFAGKENMSEGSVSTLPSEEEVPPSWEIKTLGEIADFQNGNDFSKDQWEDEGLPIIRIQNLTGTGDSYNYFSGEVHDRYRVENGDILFSWSGTIDAFKWSGDDAWLNQHIYRVDYSEEVQKDYIFHLLKRSASILEKKKIGGTLQHIRKGDVTGLEVPIPPLEEQDEIVDRIENINLNRVSRAVQDIHELLEEYRNSVLAHALTQEPQQEEKQNKRISNP